MTARSSVTRLVVASLNTRGVPMRGSRLKARYAAIGDAFEQSDVDMIAFQEVHTYLHLRWLVRHLPSFGSVSYRPGTIGPRGGLVTAARPARAPHERPARERPQYRRLPGAGSDTGLPARARLTAACRGALLTRPPGVGACIVNTHPAANRDGDWSSTNRFAGMHRRQLLALAAAVDPVPVPVVCGDFNIARDSDLFSGFLTATGLRDVFDGRCPPTFHTEYLPADRPPHCIDVILTAPQIEVADRRVLFTEKTALPGGPGHLSDHLGLQATLLIPHHGGHPD